MKYPTPQNEIELDRLYFYNLIQNPHSLPPQGLDALTAEIIRSLVLEEQLAEVRSVHQLEPARERVWHTILSETNQPTSVWPPVDPAIPPAGRYFPTGRPEPKPMFGQRSQPTRRRSVFERGQLIIIVCIVGAVLLAGLMFQVLFSTAVPTNETSEAIPAPAGIRLPPVKPQSPVIKSQANPTPKMPDPVINLKELIAPAVDDLAGVLKIDPAELQAQLFSGLSPQTLAKSLNTEPELIRNVLIESFNRQLNEGLKAGKWRAIQVEQALNETPKFVDEILNSGKY